MLLLSLWYLATVSGQQNRKRGTCVTLSRDLDIKIQAQTSWKNGGELEATFSFDRYVHRLVRRAGIINDYSFFEIQLEAMSSQGPIKLYPGRPTSPVSRITSLGNNMFQLDLVDSESKNLSRAGQLSTTLRLRHSLSGKLLYDRVNYKIVNAQLCDGGYNDIVNKNGMPGLPHGCVESVNARPTSTVLNNELATFSMTLETNLTKIGCKGRTYLGFDAPLKVEELRWPVIGATKVDKQLKKCKNSPNNGCEGHFYEIEYERKPSDFSSSQSYNVTFSMSYTGSDSHVPISTFQYNCNMNWYCEGDSVPTKPVKVVIQKEQLGWVNNQAAQAGHTVVQAEQPAQTEPQKTSDIIEVSEPKKPVMASFELPDDAFFHNSLSEIPTFDFNVWTENNMHEMLGKLNANSQRPFGLSVLGYGCTCGSFNLNEDVYGMPVDETDRACKRWRQCHKCIAMNHGTCDSPYSLKTGVCGDEVGSCQRQACECDAAFIRELEFARYDPYFAHDSIDTDQSCHRSGSSTGGSGECCLDVNDKYSWYNTRTHECCSLTGPAPTGMC